MSMHPPGPLSHPASLIQKRLLHFVQNRADCSGRAVAGVHDDAYGAEFEIGADGAKKATGVSAATEA